MGQAPSHIADSSPHSNEVVPYEPVAGPSSAPDFPAEDWVVPYEPVAGPSSAPDFPAEDWAIPYEPVAGPSSAPDFPAENGELLAALQLRRSPARTSINTQAAQTRGRPSRTRYRKQRRPIRENTRSPRRVERPSSRSTRQNVNQQSASRRPVRESTRSLRRVETPSIRTTRQNVNQRSASRRPVRESTRSLRRVETPSIRTTRQNVNQRSASRRPVRESTRSLRRVETPSIRTTRQNVNQRSASRRPVRESTRSLRRVETPSIRTTRQNVNQRSASRRPMRESTRSLRRVETPSIRPTRQNVNQRNASLNVGRSVNENEEEDYIYIPNRAGLRLVPTSRHSDSKISKEHEMNTKGIIAATSSEMPSFEYDDPVGSPPLIPRGIAAQPLRNKVANDLIKLSRYFKAPDFEDLRCPDCRNIPRMPVTGECGHTRCMRCIKNNGDCPCSVKAPKKLVVNMVVREIIDKMVQNIKEPRVTNTVSLATGDEPRMLSQRYGQSLRSTGNSRVNRPRMPMTLQARYDRARQLMTAGKYAEAAAHFARVAASSETISRSARLQLLQAINALCKKQPISIVMRSLRRSVRVQGVRSWLQPGDLECVLCTNPYACPVSLPCGHTFCRECIEHSLFYTKKCSLCLSSLEVFNVTKTRDTVFISSILSTMEVKALPEETDVLPVVTCQVAYPGMPCPLIVFNATCCKMVHEIVSSGSRRFGMLGCKSPNYGTVLEVRDCVFFEDGRCLVTTVGVSRFRIVETFRRNGTKMGRIQRLTDIDMHTSDHQHAVHLALRVHWQALCWLHAMRDHRRSVREEIETAFGSLPDELNSDLLENSPDGPYWLWWIIAILPLKQDVKTLILTTRSLVKRLAAVSRALEVVDSSVTTDASENDVEADWSYRS